MKRSLVINQTPVSVEIHDIKANSVSLTWGGVQHRFELITREGDTVVLRDEQGHMQRLCVAGLGQQTLVSGHGLDAEISEGGVSAKKKAGAAGGLNAPMPGKVFKVLVKVGDSVTKGQTLLILEAMKMEHAIKADKDGTVKAIKFKEGDLVQGGMALAELA